LGRGVNLQRIKAFQSQLNDAKFPSPIPIPVPEVTIEHAVLFAASFSMILLGISWPRISCHTPSTADGFQLVKDLLIQTTQPIRSSMARLWNHYYNPQEEANDLLPYFHDPKVTTTNAMVIRTQLPHRSEG